MLFSFSKWHRGGHSPINNSNLYFCNQTQKDFDFLFLNVNLLLAAFQRRPKGPSRSPFRLQPIHLSSGPSLQESVTLVKLEVVRSFSASCYLFSFYNWGEKKSISLFLLNVWNIQLQSPLLHPRWIRTVHTSRIQVGSEKKNETKKCRRRIEIR